MYMKKIVKHLHAKEIFHKSSEQLFSNRRPLSYPNLTENRNIMSVLIQAYWHVLSIM